MRIEGGFECDDAAKDDKAGERLVAIEAEWRGFLAALTVSPARSKPAGPRASVAHFQEDCETRRSWQAMAGPDAYAGLMLTRKSVVFRNEFPSCR